MTASNCEQIKQAITVLEAVRITLKIIVLSSSIIIIIKTSVQEFIRVITFLFFKIFSFFLFIHTLPNIFDWCRRQKKVNEWKSNDLHDPIRSHIWWWMSHFFWNLFRSSSVTFTCVFYIYIYLSWVESIDSQSVSLIKRVLPGCWRTPEPSKNMRLWLSSQEEILS